MNWLRKTMAGRYGNDQLSTALLVLSILFMLISGFSIKLQVFSFLSYIPLVACIYRTFSKDIDKRRMENYKFSIFISPLYAKFREIIKRLKEAKTHKYFRCPNCKKKLRLPRGKGKICITCSICKKEFIRKT